MKTKIILWLLLAALTIVLTFTFADLSFGQGGEVEPNNICSQAQNLGGASLPIVVEGTLGLSAYPPPDEPPDVDFFRFDGAAGNNLAVDLEGRMANKGSLGDPFLGRFDSECNLVETDDDDGEGNSSRLHFAVPENGVVILGVTGCCDVDFNGSHSQGGTYQLSIREAVYAGSISGRVLDGLSMLPLPGDVEPYASVLLLRCVDGECYEQVNAAPVGNDGTFRFNRDSAGNPLYAGMYKVEAYANGYATGLSGIFEIGEGEDKDIGDILLSRFEYIGSIRGMVIDTNTGAPIPGYQAAYAYVELFRCSDNVCTDFAATASIDDLGEFVFEYPNYMIEPGNFQLVTSIAGYLPANSNVFPVGIDEHVNIGTISVAPLPVIGSIRGRIVDRTTGEPISGFEHWSYAELYRCHEGSCEEYVTDSSADELGEFGFLGADYLIEAGDFQIIARAAGYYSETSEIFSIGSGEHLDLGDFSLTPIPLAGSISGRIIDAVTGEPLPGMEEPYVFIDLWQLNELDYYEWKNGQNTDNQGNFRFDLDYMGNRLTVGSYIITVLANEYQYFEGEVFEVGEEEHLDLGEIPLAPYPVSFSNIQSCGELPLEGGPCTYSVKITNRSGRRLTGAAWSLIDIWGTGSFIGYTQFQVGKLEKFALSAGWSDEISFSMQVPGTLLEGSTLCAQVYVGEGRRYLYFNTIGQSYLFCVQKGATGFSVLSEGETHNLMREMHQRNPGFQPMHKNPKK